VNRPFAKFDWSTRTCGRHGHITFRPTEKHLAERLAAETPAGQAWRCLRCGLYVPGEPHSSGPAEDATIVLRGRALKDAFILRLLAVERLLRGVLLLAVAYGIYKFDGQKSRLQSLIDTYVPLLNPIAQRLHVDFQATSPIRFIEKALAYEHATLMWVTAAITAYAALQFAEGIGLWLLKRWGEYVAVVGTGGFVPLEAFEVIEGASPVKVAALLINIAAVFYLVWSKRLFGMRGGHAAFEAERHSTSLLEVESSANVRPTSEEV
jgi:uncharacterized membrane protein (DUF2068 family)